MRQIKQKQTDFRKNDETIVVYCSLFLVHLPEGEHLCHAGVFDYSGISSEMLIYFQRGQLCCQRSEWKKDGRTLSLDKTQRQTGVGRRLKSEVCRTSRSFNRPSLPKQSFQEEDGSLSISSGPGQCGSFLRLWSALWRCCFPQKYQVLV